MVKRLSVKELKPDMISLEPIVTPLGQHIAPAGTTLTRQIINRMKLYKIDELLVNVADEEPDIENIAEPTPVVPVVPVMPIAPEPERTVLRDSFELEKNTRIQEIKPNSQKVIKSKQFMGFQIEYLFAINAVKDVFINVANTPGYQIDEKALVSSLSPLFASRNTIIELFDMLYQMRSIEDSIYAHCVNVALIARMIGRWLHLEPSDLDVLTCCGLLHDIGKISIPEDILNKPGRLTDEEFMLIKTHPKYGFSLLHNQNIDARIKCAALMHHERYDGSGYPSKLAGSQLNDFAMIIAIADVYDAMTAARAYREPLCPFQVIANFEQEGFQKYHTKFLLVFLDRIATTYQSNRVMLSDGRACKIVMLNQNSLSRPMVQFDDGECLDLSTQRELSITKVL